MNGVYRRTRATVTSSSIIEREHYHNTFVPFQITFQTQDPFQYLIASKSVTETDIATDWNIEFSYNGNAVSYPKVYLIFGEVTGTENISMELNDRKVVVNESITTGDVLLLDCAEKKARLGVVEVDYTGVFPDMQNGSNLFQFEIDGTYNVDITIIYQEKYL